MTAARFLVGDVFDRLATLPDQSVDLVCTSPPFLALRSYLPAGHPDKAKEIGSEASPAAFLDTMLALTTEWGRVLARHGSICVELGDTYSNGVEGWPSSKSLCGIPTLYAWSLAYGRNLLTGEPSPTGRWIVRNLVAWVRPNPPVGALGDKFRPATSYITIATRAPDRWFDLDAVRTHTGKTTNPRTVAHSGAKGDPNGHRDSLGPYAGNEHPAGAPPLDWWEVVAKGYDGSHYAVYPTELVERPIEAMCPRRVCRTCGAPSRRMVVGTAWEDRERDAVINDGGSGTHGNRVARNTTIGWSTCGCPGTDGIRPDGYHDGAGWRPGHVLDPFGGSGTTGVVASGRGRDCTLIDIDERNAGLARERLGMFLEVDYGDTVTAA